ncbi:MAG TPA: carboxylating nicotinate-nucleotide diphosphorylase [Acidimicrobiia bacterium]|nr:carboxylating nicotinate-nucleotide diphosphorylase [Acidimicrobiia bacterium]
MLPSQYLPIIRRALDEDLGLAGDQSALAVPKTHHSAGTVVARKAGRIAGVEVAAAVFHEIDPKTTVDVVTGDGADASAGQRLLRLEGVSRSLLSSERVALNLLSRMCGVATATNALVELVRGTRAHIADTRKTMPGLRVLDKYAVRVGGGLNHRFGLFDAVMIKDNHLVAAGGIRRAVEAARRTVGHTVTIEVEVTTLDQLQELLEVGAEIVLLDNMDLATMRRAVEIVNGAMIVEASGGITPDNVREIAETGVDVISVGWITHSAPALDVALDFDPPTAL